jgi:hypothetical protein
VPPAFYRRGVDTRPSSSKRGYGNKWRHIRAEILRAAGIPRKLWPLYDVHHSPPYNPDVEPDHRRYNLTPVLHAEHSTITGRGTRRGRQGGGGVKSL